MSAPNLKATFTFSVSEADEQMDMFITPTGTTAAALPSDFSVSAGYSKDYTPEQMLEIIAERLFSNIPEDDMKNLNLADPYDLEFTNSDDGTSVTFSLDLN